MSEREERREQKMVARIQVQLDEMRVAVESPIDRRQLRKYERWLNRIWLTYSDDLNGYQSLQAEDIADALEGYADLFKMESRLIGT